MHRSVALIGLPASGKTTVGLLLSRLSGLRFVDLDDRIEAAAGMSVAELFAAEGEPGFRAREREALAGLADGGPFLLATGGGCVESPENRAALKRGFFTVWLKASPAVAASRSAGVARPLLSGGALARMEALHARRLAWYEECAAMTVCVDGLEPGAIAEAIHDAIR